MLTVFYDIRSVPYSTFIAPDSELLGETWNSNHSLQTWLLVTSVVSEIKDVKEKFNFENRKEVMQNTKTKMNIIPKETFQKCFRQQKDWWAE
ncbi:hypothetical protein NPIL_265541 [Nephila pilipes]|uniref:Uncharacterized protein n=1 Tax=Nephila pilipes TaxID=299642 RepID=A0A8X6N542_NEPPI|nr:hypothetical protein NPIL_265541 [Nephila pilipes]